MTIVGLINPGAMGASIGAAASLNADQVVFSSDGRSSATIERATKANLHDCGSMKDLIGQSDIILSVCPPHTAINVAEQVAEHNFRGLYLEANAIAPDATRGIHELVTNKGATLVDGGIIGGPAWHREAGTRLWLSGEAADRFEALFEGSPLHTGIVSDQIGAASALKMTFAAYSKGTTALLSAILAVAEKEGIRAQLEQQWGADFTSQTHQRVINNSAKAWRFEGEMREIAATFAGAGLPAEFHLAAAETFSRLGEYKDWQKEPTIDELLSSLIKT